MEPFEPIFRLLCQNYASVADRMLLLRTAVSNFSTSSHEFRTGNKETNHLMAKRDYQSVRYRSGGTFPNVSVRVATLDDIWAELRRELNPSRVDILAVDIEGAEPAVLAEAPLPSPRPRLVLFEHYHLRGSEQAAIHASLLRQGYERLAAFRPLGPVSRRKEFAEHPKRTANVLYGRRGA